MSTTEPLIIWDFDGVLCDSLYECVTVTRVAAFQLEHPDAEVTRENLHAICAPDVVQSLYARLRPLRPFVVGGQDYLWQYFHHDQLSRRFESFDDYKVEYDRIFEERKNHKYERAFYAARKQVAELMGAAYFRLFQPYPAALYAFRSSLRRGDTYICTARDQHGVQLLFGDNAIELQTERIFSKDFNGTAPNNGVNKTEQILGVLERHGGKDTPFLLIEDQVKAPAELKDKCRHMRVLCAEYGYGLRSDWEAAGLPDIVYAADPSQLIYEII